MCLHSAPLLNPSISCLRMMWPGHGGKKGKTHFMGSRQRSPQKGEHCNISHPYKPIILHTERSILGLGAVLGHIDDDSNRYAVACTSCSSKNERNYTSIQGEILAAVRTKTFHPHLHGLQFKLVTEHQSRIWLMIKQDLVDQHMLAKHVIAQHCWAITFQQNMILPQSMGQGLTIKMLMHCRASLYPMM